MEQGLEKTALQIIRDMNEGVLVLNKKGKIILSNDRVEEILEMRTEELQNGALATHFFEDAENEQFAQTILDAVYTKEKVHNKVVPYRVGENKKYIRIVTSGLVEDGRTTGVVVVLSDVTELMEVRKHLKMMHEIEKLNAQLTERNNYIRNVFGRYLSNEIVDQILDKPDGLMAGGSQEHITVLMTDLRGFTALCEQIPGERIMKMLNYYLEKMGKIIRRHHGTVIEYMGDGILAIFGAPVFSENHAEDAVVAALRMQEKMKDVNEWNRANGYPELQMGIALNTGDAVVGNMGSEYAMKYNVIGKCVNLCGRMESYCVGGQILASSDTVKEVQSQVEIEPGFEVKPKGAKEELILYSVKGIGAPFYLSLTHEQEELKYLKQPKKVQLFQVDNKRIVEWSYPARILAASSIQILLKTDHKLSVYDNVLLRRDKDIYCKVVKKNGKDYLLTITGGDT